MVKPVKTTPPAKQAVSGWDTRAIEREIDQLVYQLYGLREEEINIVEGRP